MPYQIGEITNPRKDDPWFTTMDEAEAEVARLSKKDTNSPLVIWDEHCDVLKLYLCGQIFEPA